jgi:copper resistance protein C
VGKWGKLNKMDRVASACRALLLSAGLLILPYEAWGHAIIVSSSPANGATVPQGPVSIHLRFNSRIDHSRSRLILLTPDGGEQPLTVSSGSPADGFDVDPKTLLSGQWHVRWQVLSVDGHITRGDIPFTVR